MTTPERETNNGRVYSRVDPATDPLFVCQGCGNVVHQHYIPAHDRHHEALGEVTRSAFLAENTLVATGVIQPA